VTRRVWLNIDLGELGDEPEGLYAAAHIANIACGGHAGDTTSMTEALARCKRHGTLAGAHPSYPDRANFGRTRMEIDPHALRGSVASQCDALADLAEQGGVVLHFMKPHGALYHAAHDDEGIADAVIAGAIESLGYEIRVLGPAGGALAEACRRAGVALEAEGFADRAMRPDGSLVPRTEPNALITDPARAAEQARTLLREGRFDTLCVHGDTPGAIRIAMAVRHVIDELYAGM
jgi:UPF0271 protein